MGAGSGRRLPAGGGSGAAPGHRGRAVTAARSRRRNRNRCTRGAPPLGGSIAHVVVASIFRYATDIELIKLGFSGLSPHFINSAWHPACSQFLPPPILTRGKFYALHGLAQQTVGSPFCHSNHSPGHQRPAIRPSRGGPITAVFCSAPTPDIRCSASGRQARSCRQSRLPNGSWRPLPR